MTTKIKYVFKLHIIESTEILVSLLLAKSVLITTEI